jgi:putative colanic acid biosynthesis UDP-glucose lipid carrier transferase
MLFIAAAVKITLKGPIIFKPRRYDINGKMMAVWKFRSITTCDNADVVVQTVKNDARITKLGEFLRKSTLMNFPNSSMYYKAR